MDNGIRRRSRTDYEDLDKLLEEAEYYLGDEDLRTANTLLKQAGVQATSMWGVVGGPALPKHTQRLIYLIAGVQKDLSNPGRNSLDALLVDLRELRSSFEMEARRENEAHLSAKR